MVVIAVHEKKIEEPKDHFVGPVPLIMSSEITSKVFGKTQFIYFSVKLSKISP